MLSLRVARKLGEETWVQGFGGKTLREELYFWFPLALHGLLEGEIYFSFSCHFLSPKTTNESCDILTYFQICI
jgi:hypothetical protein